MDDILVKIRDFADNAHGNQMRKYSSDRYIVHPVRVMKICQKYNSSLPVLAAALLHDVVEDTSTGNDDVLFFLETIMDSENADLTLKLVVELTDVYTKEAYPEWNRTKRKEMEHERLSKVSPKAQTIKYADIIDNSKEISSNDREFAPRYLKECKEILLLADKGNSDLHSLAIATVQSELYNLKREYRR